VVESIRTIGETVSTELRYYISSLPADPVMFGTSVRAHWGIEDTLHYILDVVFGGGCLSDKNGNGPENRAFIRKIAFSLARSDTDSKRSIASRINNLALKGEVCCSLVVVRLWGSYLNNAQATQRVAKLPREPVSGFLGMNPFATNQRDGLVRTIP
jgi:predicted transposase YbfD/YdcC